MVVQGVVLVAALAAAVDSRLEVVVASRLVVVLVVVVVSLLAARQEAAASPHVDGEASLQEAAEDSNLRLPCCVIVSSCILCPLPLVVHPLGSRTWPRNHNTTSEQDGSSESLFGET